MKPEPRPAIQVEKQLGWACKLGGTESLGISGVGQTVLAMLMEPQIWHQPAGSVALKRAQKTGKGLYTPFYLGESCSPALALMPDNSVSPWMPLVPFKLLA